MARSFMVLLGVVLGVAGAVACGGGEVDSGGASGGKGGAVATGGTGGAPDTTTTSPMNGTTTSATAVTSVGVGGTGGGAADCDPPAEPGTLYAMEDEGLFDIGPSSMCKYRGEVLLIVNTAGA